MNPTKEQFLAAIARIENLSAAPMVLRRAMTLLRNPDSSIADVVGLIRTDTALTADVIRGANSAFYGAGERVSSLERAVEKIGFRESIRLLNLAVAHLLAARDLSSYGIPDEAFWAESLFHGVFLEELARATGGGDPDTAHTAGLLRFVGRLAINQAIDELGAGLFWDGHEPLGEWEIAQVGFPQAHAAGILLRAWRFPEDLSDALEHQDDPPACARPGNWYADALHFAAAVVPAGIPGVPDPAAVARPPASAFAERHALTAEGTSALLEAARGRFGDVSRNLYD